MYILLCANKNFLLAYLRDFVSAYQILLKSDHPRQNDHVTPVSNMVAMASQLYFQFRI